MKKSIVIMLMVCLLPAMLFANGSTEKSVSAGEVTVVKVWTEDRHDLDYVQKKVDEYNANNTDNIKIELTVVTENYKNMLQLSFQSGDAPDVVGANSLPLNLFADTGILNPLDSYIAKSPEYIKVNEPASHKYEGLNVSKGNTYWIPSGMRSGVRVIYNKDLLKAAGYTEIPRTLSDYIDMAKAITVNGKGKYYGIGFTSSSPFERLLEMTAQCSGIFYYDYVNGKFDFSGYRPILEQGKRFIDESIAYPDQQQVDMMRAQFAVGSFALWSNASQEAGVFTSQIPVKDFEWATAEVPTLTGKVTGALQITPSKGWGIVSNSKVKDAAWKVISFFQGEEFLKGYLESGYCLPITSYMDGLIDKTKIGRLADFSLLDYESVYPQPPVVNISGDDYRTTLWNCVMGFKTIDATIADLNKRYNDALERDIKNGTVKRLIIKDYNPQKPNSGTFEYLTK
ncbi:extracellular solute-binding protein [uncultured Sphaerochaeta sp.]|uniref:ABC transporter substrate-binding protein n=1 Tax=uncultured Sphaerochaeta sp. TaxID=886478 RepID=UPI002A0A3443|nr:extracellular solute-binding protein [uncultured Sphaerochaeta sp.]